MPRPRRDFVPAEATSHCRISRPPMPRRTSTTPSGRRSYKSDSLWSYEVGEKARFLDRRLTVNASVYYEDWTQIQLEELPFGYPLFDNAGDAKIYGGELELKALLGARIHAVGIRRLHACHARARDLTTRSSCRGSRWEPRRLRWCRTYPNTRPILDSTTSMR